MMNKSHLTPPPLGRRSLSKITKSFALLAVLAYSGSALPNVRADATPEGQSPSPITDPKPTAPAHFEGSLDIVDVGSVRGWAMDGSRPEKPIQVEIYDGNTLLSTIVASEFREDLKNAGKGDGKHAFNYPLPQTLRDGQSHTISVKYAGSSSDLPGSPKTLLFPK
jgi:hypothetical protein